MLFESGISRTSRTSSVKSLYKFGCFSSSGHFKWKLFAFAAGCCSLLAFLTQINKNPSSLQLLNWNSPTQQCWSSFRGAAVLRGSSLWKCLFFSPLNSTFDWNTFIMKSNIHNWSHSWQFGYKIKRPKYSENEPMLVTLTTIISLWLVLCCPW